MQINFGSELEDAIEYLTTAEDMGDLRYALEFLDETISDLKFKVVKAATVKDEKRDTKSLLEQAREDELQSTYASQGVPNTNGLRICTKF